MLVASCWEDLQVLRWIAADRGVEAFVRNGRIT